jgi:hypothetical protein
MNDNNILDIYDIFLICVGISLVISLPIFFYNISKNIEEKECVKFYKENNYILNSCKKYQKKLKISNK